MSLVAWKVDEAHLAVPIDLTLYTVPAVMHAAFKMTDRVFVLLQRDDERTDRLWVYFFARHHATDVKPLALEFMNELVDQQLRAHLEQQFHDVRTLIVAQAFAEGNLLTRTDDDLDYRADPHDAGKAR